jgi:thiosulfate/3-mercaptopyruvate sulfurtransferase
MKNKLLAFMATAALAAAATNSAMLVTPEWLVGHLTDPNVVIVHVSANRSAYDAGHIPGARFVAMSELAVTVNGVPYELPPVEDLQRILQNLGISDDSRVILYGDTSPLAATRAYFTLDYIGIGDHAALLDGGLDRWRREGYTLTQDPPPAAQGHLSPHPHPEIVAKIEQVKQIAENHGPEALLDARPATDYSGEKGAHIAGAHNVYWMQSQVSREDQTLKPEGELRKLYEAAGIAPGSKVVTYCVSGIQASQAYFTLKYLGYDVRMFDGSMAEWNRNKEPVEK